MRERIAKMREKEYKKRVDIEIGVSRFFANFSRFFAFSLPPSNIALALN
jgi:hypothetical protein